ncbi:hypothetical protein ABTW24_19165 [Sphingobacterium thalpophilum]|uniref:Uncharacterized protein n=1 Tax=Sphingobacterium thalpophilum TaxID=259 RepID=A0ABV4HGT4_9SPHI
MEQNKKVLISGASFAGLTTAYWLVKMGFGVTVSKGNFVLAFEAYNNGLRPLIEEIQTAAVKMLDNLFPVLRKK